MGGLDFVIVFAIILVVAWNSSLIEGRSTMKSMHLSWGTQRSGFLQPSGRDDVTLILDPVSGTYTYPRDLFGFDSRQTQYKSSQWEKLNFRNN